MTQNVKLSVVIPAYNEESRLPGTLRHVCAYLDTLQFESEVLVVDDGSIDRTAKMVRTFNPAKPPRLIQHPDGANHGKGAAVRRGMLEARGEYRIFMDADNSTTIDQISSLWPWFDQGYDIVIGSRQKRGAQVVVRQAWYKQLAGRCGNLAIRCLAVPGIADTQAGFKMFSGRATAAIFPRQTIDRWGFDVEILAIARQLGYRIREVPIIWINAPASKVQPYAYIQVLGEVWHIRRNIRAGIYLRSAS